MIYSKKNTLEVRLHAAFLIFKMNHHLLPMHAVIHSEGNRFRVVLPPPITTCILFLSHSLTNRFLPAPKKFCFGRRFLWERTGLEATGDASFEASTLVL